MARTHGALPAPSSRRTTRQRASSAKVPRNSPSQATEASRIPPSESGEATGLSSPAPQPRYETRRPPTTLGATTSHPKSLGESSRASEPPADSELPSDMSSSRLSDRYHLEHLMTPREFFYPKVALDFYQSMTTCGVRSPTAIHFTIDERYGVLEAKQIVEALHIPFEPNDPSIFHQWFPVSQRDMVHILSRGTSTNSVLLWKELPPGMLLLDVVLYSNLFPLQYLV
ncbi:hypothetical protein AAG906_004927 [Vitis piasezkii]